MPYNFRKRKSDKKTSNSLTKKHKSNDCRNDDNDDPRIRWVPNFGHNLIKSYTISYGNGMHETKYGFTISCHAHGNHTYWLPYLFPKINDLKCPIDPQCDVAII